MRSHEWIDRRSLALHEAVAAKLEAHPICCGWLARTSSDGCAPMRPPRPIRNENTGSATGWRLEIHDLAVSQQARRERVLEFVQVLLGERLVDPAVLGHRGAALAVPDERLEVARQRLNRLERPRRRSGASDERSARADI